MSNSVETGTKKVSIKISEEEFKTLKNNGYSICFAKRVGDYDYNVVWRAAKEYFQNVIFSWKPLYSMFATDTFESGVQVKVSTEPKKIGLGETVTLKNIGLFTNAVTGGTDTALNLVNEYGNTHIGISQVASLDGKEASTPIFVSENEIILGSDKFKPVEKVMVWFESDIESSTMIADLRSNALEIDLTETNAVDVEYSNGKWSCIE